jgi:hypothetical protein
MSAIPTTAVARVDDLVELELHVAGFGILLGDGHRGSGHGSTAELHRVGTPAIDRLLNPVASRSSHDDVYRTRSGLVAAIGPQLQPEAITDDDLARQLQRARVQEREDDPQHNETHGTDHYGHYGEPDDDQSEGGGDPGRCPALPSAWRFGLLVGEQRVEPVTRVAGHAPTVPLPVPAYPKDAPPKTIKA